MLSRVRRWLRLINFVAPVLIANLVQVLFGSSTSIAQSIGYQPSFTLGFNPYLSPVFGYGLGVPFGAYSFSPSKYPWFTNSFTGLPFGQSSVNLLSKVHAKSVLKKIIPNPYYGSLKNKLALMKHPEYSFTPYGLDYGYGKHYGAAVLPNNPYKSTYIDYYNNPSAPTKTGTGQQSFETLAPQSSNIIPAIDYNKSYKIIKPLIKAGALLTTAALLGKRSLDSYPIRLNPAGMILNGGNV